MLTLITTNGIMLPSGYSYKNSLGYVAGDNIVYNIGYNSIDDLGCFALISDSMITVADIPAEWNICNTIPIGYKDNNGEFLDKKIVISCIYTLEDEFKLVNLGISNKTNTDYLAYRSIVDSIVEV